MSLRYGHNGYDPADVAELIRWAEEARKILDKVALEEVYTLHYVIDAQNLVEQAKELGI